MVASSMFKVYVANLPWSVDDSELFALFAEFGKVKDARVVTDKENQRSRGFGFVSYDTREDAEAAIKASAGREHKGRRLTVELAKPKQR